MLKALLTRNHPIGISTTSPTPFSLQKFLTTATPTSDPSYSFGVSYLINNFGFSPESALGASNYVRFKTPQQPHSVLAFFRNHGFSDSHLYTIIRKEPWLLSCDTHKRLLPKFQFLASKGASTSDIVRTVMGSPRFLKSSLEDCIIPSYASVNRFLQSDRETLALIIRCPSLLYCGHVASNIRMLVDNGVAGSNVCRILRLRPYVLCSNALAKTVTEIKSLGFDPSKVYFADAMLAKRVLSESKRREKIDAFKRWGWSEEKISEAFRKQPTCMLASSEKIDRVMRFWVNELGWDSSLLVQVPGIFGYSLEKRIIPRASVVHYLLSKGLRKKHYSLLTPFFMSEKLFLQKFVTCFDEQETSQLLKLYQEKMDIEGDSENGGMMCSSNI
ncbi:hypothetical protein RIF29_04015 [Crotalaria pallida]|uniref:mTERF protein n=1 Tax=Crotalaria pallida TaxID=3830 RepID=A0AAN9P9T7_CROPI